MIKNQTKLTENQTHKGSTKQSITSPNYNFSIEEQSQTRETTSNLLNNSKAPTSGYNRHNITKAYVQIAKENTKEGIQQRTTSLIRGHKLSK